MGKQAVPGLHAKPKRCTMLIVMKEGAIELQVRRYERRFRRPLVTARRRYESRIGFLVRMIDAEGREGFGEIAPWPEMGSETVEEAGAFLDYLAGGGRFLSLPDIPTRLTACRWGLSCAWENVRRDRSSLSRTFSVAGLLPAGAEALGELAKLHDRGFRVFKWKIGVGEPSEEQSVFDSLCRAAPDAFFRLDANGGLTLESARDWLSFLEGKPVEFLEQPLDPESLDGLRGLAAEFIVPIALDESVGTRRDWETLRVGGWEGPVVLKPSVFGTLEEARRLIREARVVFSSVFETSVGLEAILCLAAEAGSVVGALGLGTASWMEEDGLNRHATGPSWQSGSVVPSEIWRRLE